MTSRPEGSYEKNFHGPLSGTAGMRYVLILEGALSHNRVENLLCMWRSLITIKPFFEVQNVGFGKRHFPLSRA